MDIQNNTEIVENYLKKTTENIIYYSANNTAYFIITGKDALSHWVKQSLLKKGEVGSISIQMLRKLYDRQRSTKKNRFLSLNAKSWQNGFRPAKLVNPGKKIVDAARQKICNSSLSKKRKAVLDAAADHLQNDLSQAAENTQLTIYIMEGATKLSEGSAGRPSTDPDEDAAIAAIAALSQVKKQAGILIVPDKTNVEHTLRFLKETLGADAEEFDPGKSTFSKQIYVASMEDQNSLRFLGKIEHNLVLLGPPLTDFCALLVDSAKIVTIMGKIEKNQAGELEGRSTNTRGNQAFLIKLSEKEYRMFPSSEMGELTVSFEELEKINGKDVLPIVTEEDRFHWLNNTRMQLMTAYGSSKTELPGTMLLKRLKQGGVEAIYQESWNLVCKGLEKDPQKRLLGFELFLEKVSGEMIRTNPHAVEQKINSLGIDYGVWTPAQAKDYLQELVQGFEQKSAFANDPSLIESKAASLKIIEQMDDEQALASAVSLALAFKNIYEEKTVGGWGLVPGTAHASPDIFAQIYLSNGRQVLYDALVVLAEACGREELSKEDADKIMLLLSGFIRIRKGE